MAAENLFKNTAPRILLAFAITALLVGIFTAVDAGRRKQLEGYDFPTALNDEDLFDLASFEYNTEIPVAQFKGVPLYPQRSDPVERYDKYMRKLGRDDSDQFYLYHYSKRGSSTPEGIYFVKVGLRSYLELGVEIKILGGPEDESSETPPPPEPSDGS